MSKSGKTKQIVVAKTPSPEETERIFIHNKIHEIRGQKVMLDFDLAALYEVETRVLKQAVKRNMERFPKDFMFQLTKDEWQEVITICDNLQYTLKFSPALPFAFTEQGVSMLSSILRSKKAIQINILIMRVFVFIRQYALSHKDLTDKLKELEAQYNKQFKDIYEAINYLLQKDKKETDKKIEEENWKNRERIGFKK
jgi:hypothetical protein